MKKIIKLRLLVLQLTAASILAVSSLGFGLTASAGAQSLKPVPVAPATASNVVTAPLAPKSRVQTPTLPSGGSGWSVTLVASPTFLWPTQFSTLTATANRDVGPTPYYISIYDLTAHSYIATCAFGATCSRAVTQPTAATHYFIANISLPPSLYPPSGIQATSSTVGVTWKSVSISLRASPTTLSVGSTATLTSTTSADIGPSPFYAEIFDVTTGTRIGICGFGTICNATTSRSVATTDTFIAYVSNPSASLPPSGIQAISNRSFVTWSNAGYRLSLSASRTSFGHDTVTALSNVNVRFTPYWIEIFNLDTGVRIADCGFSSTCSATVPLSFGNNHFVAFTSAHDTFLPPSSIQASSNVVTDFFFPFF